MPWGASDEALTGRDTRRLRALLAQANSVRLAADLFVPDRNEQPNPDDLWLVGELEDQRELARRVAAVAVLVLDLVVRFELQRLVAERLCFRDRRPVQFLPSENRVAEVVAIEVNEQRCQCVLGEPHGLAVVAVAQASLETVVW